MLVGVVTGARSDYGIYRPILRTLVDDAFFNLHLYVTGMHLAREFGYTVDQILTDGFRVDERVEMLLSSDTPEGLAKSMGLGTMGFAQVYARCRPDLLIVLGDRFEMHAAAVAALPFKIPVAHIHGGESTEGAIDDSLRHSLTKMSHLHFVATEEYARRVIQMGEEPWRVTVCGAPSLDNLLTIKLVEKRDLERKLGFPLNVAPLLVTYHSVTLEYEQAEWQVGELLAALGDEQRPIIFTLPNADTQGRSIAHHIREFVQRHPSARLIETLGTELYFSLMAQAAAMVGNSSSGIVEAPSFGLPVVNVGTRQQGRVRATNVIDVSYDRRAVAAGIRKACSEEFRASLKGLQNPYGDGHAAETISGRLKEVGLSERLIVKKFWTAKGMGLARSSQ
jgi:UDP-hydrolysing UDP-N-acetyl-D-glucosamine 2-epimerase